MSEPAYTRRKFNPAYHGKNGFISHVVEPVVDTQADDAMQVDHPRDDTQQKLAAQKKERKLRDAIEKHRQVDEVLEARGSYFPGMDAVNAELALEENAANLKNRISEVETQFHDEMNTMYDLIAQDYLADAEDAYYNKDNTFSIREIEQFYEKLRRPDAPTLHPLYNTISEVRYAHLSTLTTLRRRYQKQQKQEDAQFPADVPAFHAIKSHDHQLRVARFLMSDTQTKERMLTDFGWAWRLVKPLEDTYAANAEFKAEVQKLVQDLEAKDPRRRTSTTLAA